MTERAVILISRGRADANELLFIKPRGALFYQFPVATKTDKTTIKSAIRKTLEEALQAEAQEIRKVDVTGYQYPGEPFKILALYIVRIKNDPQATQQIDEVVWLSKNEALKRTAQMTNVMQDHVFPCLEENNLW